MNIDPGELDKRVVLLAPKTVADSYGDAANTFTTLGAVWARIRTKAGSEYWQGEQAIGTTVHEVLLRYDPYGAHLTTKHRVSYKLRVLEIRSVENVDEENEFVRLTCVELR